MSKDLNVSRLCDAYGALLTDHRRELVRNYYDFDLSLAEIAENFGITRQAALCAIKQAVNRLYEYENALGAVKKADELEEMLQRILDEMDGDSSAAKRELTALLSDIRR